MSATGQAGKAVDRDFTAAIYGTIVVAGVVGSLGQADVSIGAVIASVLATSGVFWLAHVWAQTMSERLRDPQDFTWARFATIARHEWSMVQSATLPVLALLLAAFDVYSEETAIDVALAITIVQLFGWGLLVGRRTFERWPSALLSGVVNGAFGVVIVVLKTLIH
ncbi:hypothetical protein [Conexibacter sp. CPCC 206217]|uniref:hypothetical protein n=1 Tax=Conexibacter sp. CPCC 206217 TaxID=3064574 RepID=UPI00271C1209|nr:hypothetical protein [Conexibacter sp. CPCC 206217]MDO8210783.1 hypothetical protein [Conexibacter sp. CPCC 206217]